MISLCVRLTAQRSRVRSSICFATFSSAVSKDNIDFASYVLPSNTTHPNLATLRHSTAHVLAMAVQRLNPECKVALGPCTENGFYYDFYFPKKQLSDGDLKTIQKEMIRIIRRKLPFRREVLSRDEARRRIEIQQEPYKLQVLDSLPEHDSISVYHVGQDWWDLCRGPHVENTGDIDPEALQLESVAGAYWRGDEKQPMLQRVYGTVWESPEQLSVYQHRIAEAKRRDHRVLGKRLNLFSIQEDAGGGLVFWHAKGSRVRRAIEDYWKNEHINDGYELLYTPHIANLDLWKTSGHCDFYKDDMFRPIAVDEDMYQLRPMNCPFHCLVYKDAPRSYRDLPLRWAELGTVYRYERSGTLHGLMRVRGFTQDDAHIFCTPEQLQREIVGVLDLAQRILNRFGFKSFDVMLSTRPKDSVGSDEIWNIATTALESALQAKQWQYSVDEGGGAFYGPKIDLKIRDAIGRSWQCSTIQCDFNLPERFQLEYTAPDQSKLQPIMVHRAIFGSLERFLGVLLESTAGDLPFWLAPTHMRLLPVTDDAHQYCASIVKAASVYGLRVEVDSTHHRIGKQIRNAEMEKIPVMGVVGVSEMEKGEVSLRVRGKGDVGRVSYVKALEVLAGVLRNDQEPLEAFSWLGDMTVDSEEKHTN